MPSRSEVIATMLSWWPSLNAMSLKLDLDLALSDLPPDQLMAAVVAYRGTDKAEFPPTPDKLRKLAGREKPKKLDLPPSAELDSERDRKWAIGFWGRLGFRASHAGDEATALECGRHCRMIEARQPPNQEEIAWRKGWWDHLESVDRMARLRRYEDWDTHHEGPHPLWDLGSALDGEIQSSFEAVPL